MEACLVVPVKLSRLLHAMKVHVHPGLIGQDGVIARLTVTVVSNHAPASVLMERKVIVKGQQLMNNNAIDNLVNAKWSFGIIVSQTHRVGPISQSNIYPLVKQHWINALRTAYHCLVASQSQLHDTKDTKINLYHMNAI